MSGKGYVQRPRLIEKTQWDKNWANTFGKTDDLKISDGDEAHHGEVASSAATVSFVGGESGLPHSTDELCAMCHQSIEISHINPCTELECPIWIKE